MAEKKTPNKLLPIAAGAVLLAAGGWYAWRQFMEEPPLPPPPRAVQPAAAPAANPDKVIGELLTVSGLDHLFARLPEQMLAGVRQAGQQGKRGSLAPADLAELERLAKESFSEQAFRRGVENGLRKQFEAKRYLEFTADSSTPLAMRMNELEKREPKPEELAAFVAGLSAKPLSQERVKLIERIDAAGRVSELATEAMFASVRGMARGIAGSDAKQLADADRAIEQQRAAAGANIRNAVRLTLAHAYREVSDADLAEYVRLHEKDSTQFVLGLVFDALIGEIRSGAERFGAGLENMARNRHAAQAKPAARSRANEDARECLRFEENLRVMGCAERYR